MALNIYNTLTRRKEEFKPLAGVHVGMYVCGPTVYGHSHVGHAKSYISFDVIVRFLRYLEYTVTYIQNITDVGHMLGEANEGEDRLVRQSLLENKHPMEVAEEYTRSYFEDMDALGVLRPEISPRATGHIIEQIEIIKGLIKKGYAYEVEGSVYFDVAKCEGYGKLSGRSLDEIEAGTRIEVRSEKRHPSDFALWKNAEPKHIMRWPSPWGTGFPGWHIECSAMSMKYLGETIDIHGGGMDNQFPHHECEIAQSESLTGKPFVRYWIHNNLVTVKGRKMSKSLGNVILLKTLFKKYDPMVIRFFILQSQYRSTLDFTDEALDGAARGYEKLINTVRNVREARSRSAPAGIDAGPGVDLGRYGAEFMSAMNDDLNTPQAIAVLFDLSHEMNGILAKGGGNPKLLVEVDAIYSAFGGAILGIIPETLESVAPSGAGEADMISFIIGLRSDARAQKLWAFSDKIRDGLLALGVTLEDKKEGTTWHRA